MKNDGFGYVLGMIAVGMTLKVGFWGVVAYAIYRLAVAL